MKQLALDGTPSRAEHKEKAPWRKPKAIVKCRCGGTPILRATFEMTNFGPARSYFFCECCDCRRKTQLSESSERALQMWELT